MDLSLFKQIAKAIRKNQAKVVCTLVEKSDAQAITQTRDRGGRTLFMVSAEEGRLELLKYLYRSGCNPEDYDFNGRRALHEAVKNCHLDCCHYLINDLKCDVNATKLADWTPLMLSCLHCEFAIVTCLVENGASLELVNKDGWTCLHIASRAGSPEVVSYLIEKCPSLLAMLSYGGQNCLHIAALNGKNDVIDVLLSKDKAHNLNIDDTDCCGTTALMMAITNSFLSTAQRLITKYNANPHIVNLSGKSCVHMAAEVGATEIIEYLYQNGYDIFLPDEKTKMTSLHYAARHNRLSLVQSLAEKMDLSRLQFRDSHDRTALDLSRSFHHKEISAYLEDILNKKIKEEIGE